MGRVPVAFGNRSRVTARLSARTARARQSGDRI